MNWRRILSVLLTLCMVLTLLPALGGTSYAADPPQSMIGGIPRVDNGGYVYMGGIRWRVIGKTNDKYLMISSDGIGLPFIGVSDAGGQTLPRYGQAETICGTVYNSSFSAAERGTVVKTTKEESAYNNCTDEITKPNMGSYSFTYQNFSGTSLTDATVFIMSVLEVRTYFSSTGDRSPGGWWLRNSVTGPSGASATKSAVRTSDKLIQGADQNNDYMYYARPVFQMSRENILFETAYNYEKPGVSGELTEFSALTPAADVDRKLTLVDSTRSFTAQAADGAILSMETGYEVWGVDIDVTGAGSGENEYVSAILYDSTGTPLYYGAIGSNVGANTDTLYFYMPEGLAAGAYTLKVFSETRNGEKATDYASQPSLITLTVADPVYEVTLQADSNGAQSITYSTADSQIAASYDDIPDKDVCAFYYQDGDIWFHVPGSGGLTPPEPYDETYTFVCWNGIEFDSEFQISGNIILTATWDERSAYSITPTTCTLEDITTTIKCEPVSVTFGTMADVGHPDMKANKLTITFAAGSGTLTCDDDEADDLRFTCNAYGVWEITEPVSGYFSFEVILDDDVFGCKPGTYTGAIAYTAKWSCYSIEQYHIATLDITDECYNGSIALTLTIPETFGVYCEAPENGTITANICNPDTGETVEEDIHKAEANDTIKVIPAPAKGYEVKSVSYYYYADENAVEPTVVPIEEVDGKYTFTMPAAPVAITAEFKPSAPIFEEYRMRLSDEICLEYYLNLPDDYYLDDAEVVFTLSDGRVNTVPVTGSGWVSCEINVLELADTIEADFFNGGDLIIRETGYSAATYFDELRDEYGEDEELMGLIDSLEELGAQMYLSDYYDVNENGEEIDKSLHNQIDTKVELDSWETLCLGLRDNTLWHENPVLNSDDWAGTGIEDIRMSLTLNAAAKINLYIKPEPGVTITSAYIGTVKFGDETYYVIQFGPYKIADLAAGLNMSDEDRGLTVKLSNGQTYTRILYPLSYIRMMLESDNVLEANNRRAFIAFADFALRAHYYSENHPQG